MAGLAVLLLILLLLATPGLAIYLACRWVHTRRTNAGAERRGERIAIALVGTLAISSPYLLFKAGELHFALSRVPQPLDVSWIEYRLEHSWGFGLPGDNETGFIIYRMTGGSARWARNQGQNLGALLPGGAAVWHMTPVDESGDHDRWHTYDSASTTSDQAANLKGYLDTYGYSIPIEKGPDIEFNDAIQNPGSFYSYGRGSSVIVVDPKRGKIYVAYPG